MKWYKPSLGIASAFFQFMPLTTVNAHHNQRKFKHDMLCLVIQLCPTFWDPMDYKPSRLLCPWIFSTWEYWSGLPCPPPGDLPNPRIEPRSPALQADSLPSEPQGSSKTWYGGLSGVCGQYNQKLWAHIITSAFSGEKGSNNDTYMHSYMHTHIHYIYIHIYIHRYIYYIHK